MLSSELDYFLPPQLIAQTPVEPRDSARLLHFQTRNSQISHHIVRDLPALLREGDLLVFNDTRVLRARLLGHKTTGGKVEALLLKERALNRWEALVKPSARLQVGARVTFSRENCRVEAVLRARLGQTWEIEFLTPENRDSHDVRDLLSELGEVPLPPYIHEKSDEERYQTTFSRRETLRVEGRGALDSAAAPTAGLHFTPELFENLRARGVDWTFVTLAVGAGTFAPVKTEKLEDHAMHGEEFWISDEAAAKINAQKRRGGRVVAVGTTAVRTLESMAIETQNHGEKNSDAIRSGNGETFLFLRPGSPFRVVDALFTNFHLPKSTLLALVAAFIEARTRSEESAQPNGENGSISVATPNSSQTEGFATVRALYAEAIAQEYRFFSFGDAMLVE